MFYANEAMMITLWKNVKVINCPGLESLNVTNFQNTSFISSNQIACITTGQEVLQMLSMDEVK
jgi:hypothetical protein